MRRNRTTVVAVLGVASLSLVACGGGGDSGSGGGTDGQEITEVSVSVTHPEDLYGLPWEVGRDQGFFEENGVNVAEIIPAEGGGTTLQNVVSGRLPFGEVATGAIVSGAQEGAPVQVIGGGIQSVADVSWVASLDSDLESLDDAAGSRWGFTNPGSVTQAMSFLTPEALGFDPTAVDRTSTGGTGAGIALLEAGDVDLTYASPRVAMDNEETLKVVGNSAEHVPAYQQTMIISSRDYASENPEVARGLLAGYHASVQWIEENPAEAAELWAEIAELDPEDAQTILDDALAADHWGVAYNPEALDAAAEALVYTHEIDDAGWADLLTDEYLPEDQKGQIP